MRNAKYFTKRINFLQNILSDKHFLNQIKDLNKISILCSEKDIRSDYGSTLSPWCCFAQ